MYDLRSSQADACRTGQGGAQRGHGHSLLPAADQLAEFRDGGDYAHLLKAHERASPPLLRFSYTVTIRPNHGCHGYRTSRDSVCGCCVVDLYNRDGRVRPWTGASRCLHALPTRSLRPRGAHLPVVPKLLNQLHNHSKQNRGIRLHVHPPILASEFKSIASELQSMHSWGFHT